MSDHREAVRSNARYLRNVRPIDPDEICEYVEGAPHPAVVRQVLREEAVDLGLLETAAGTFVPVAEEPVTPLGSPVECVPERYERMIDDLLVDRYGPDWAEGAAGDLLRSTIRRFKAQYLNRDAVAYDEDVAAGYALYHFPAYFAAIQYALDDLAERGLLGRSLRVLDVGAGVGGPGLGLLEYLPSDALVEYHAIEPSAAADVLEWLLDDAGRNAYPTIHRTTVESFVPDSAVEWFDQADEGGFDLVLVCNVLSELDDPKGVLEQTLEWTASDGAVVAMAPADKHTSTQLRSLERAVESDAVTVYSPAVRFWPGHTPSDRGWTFDVRPDLQVPPFQRRLEDAASGPEHSPGEFVNVDVQFSYSILRRDGRRRIELEPDAGSWAKMAEMDRHVTNRIDLVAAKLSRSLSGGGEGKGGNSSASRPNPLFKISDGSERVDHYAVVTSETELNRPLLDADYGDVCSFENVLVLWNVDEGAYNLVVDEETIVDRVA